MTPATQGLSEADHARRRWRCRRGLLELDLILAGFLRFGFDALAPDQRAAFDRMLQLPDQVLQGYFFLGDTPADPELRGLIDRMIRSDVRPDQKL